MTMLLLNACSVRPFAGRASVSYGALSYLSRRPIPRSSRTLETVRGGQATRHSTTLETGENKTGHINQAPNEGVLFFNNIFPLRLQWLMFLPWQSGNVVSGIMKHLQNQGIAGADPLKLIEQSDSLKTSMHIGDVVPRMKEGGAFLRFSHDASVSSTQVEAAVQSYLKEQKVRPWFNPFQRIHANLVRGRPWIEDLYRLPTLMLKVEFLPAVPGEKAVELSQEQLYEFFRPYGKLADIVPQPEDSKVTPRYANLVFTSKQKAITARNCMHSYVVKEEEGGGKVGTLLRISYEQRIKAHWIRDWIFNHPKVVIPALAALVAAITVAIFDPIRTWFIEAHITRTFHLADNRVYKWFVTQATDILQFRKRKADSSMEAIWDDRKGNIDQMKTWLMETADTFIIVQGPRGSGKRELVDQALKHRKNKLIIDCKPIQEARGDSSTIAAAAVQVGYRPVFSWMNSISGLVDLAAQGATGMKTGFSETLDTQLAKIFNNTGTALRNIALETRRKDDKDATLPDDEWLEAHPERRPVVIVDNFLHKSQENNIVYDKIAEWAAGLTTTNIAHVVFLTNDVSFSKSLSKALPDRVFRQLSLSDCSPEVAKRFVITHLNSEIEEGNVGDEEKQQKKPQSLTKKRKDLQELDECISFLGGRLTDLEFLARRIKTGETPKRAVGEIIQQSASEILKMYIFTGDDSSRKWTPQQAWLLIKSLAHNETVRYNELLLSDTYKTNGDTVLQALEQAELITIVSDKGRPSLIKPGKPVYQSAFNVLIEDNVLRSRLDLAILNEQIKIENTNIEKYENELHVLSELRKQPPELTTRVQWLCNKVMSSQKKVEQYETESSVLKKVLVTEF